MMTDNDFYAELIRQARQRCDPEMLRRLDQSARPSPARLMAVATGRSKFTAQEREAIDQSPELQRHERETRETVRALLEHVNRRPSVSPGFEAPESLPLRQASGAEFARCVAAGSTPPVEAAEAERAWVGRVTPRWREPPPNRAPAELTVTCRILDLPDGRQLAVTVTGLDEHAEVRYQALLAQGAPAPDEPPAQGWSLSNTWFTSLPERIGKMADLKGRHLFLFLAARREDRYVPLLQAPVRLSLE
jgi:hypothetical protein